MLRCYATDTQSRVHSLPALCRLRISESRGVPADSLRIVLYGTYEEEFCRIFVYDEDELVFTAEVDEQIAKVSENSYTELICRSTAAVLLDNEAKPQIFVNPSCELIFREYAAPYGFIRCGGLNRCFQGEFSIPKGISCYEVIDKFSLAVFGNSPKVAGDEIYFDGEQKKPEIVFCDEGNGLPFTDFTFNRLRCRRLSKIYVKTTAEAEYNTEVCDEDALRKGIRKERYMDASEFAENALADAHRAVRLSRAKSKEISLVYPGKLLDVISASVKVYFQGKMYDGYEVERLDYTLGEDAEYTRVVLCRKEK